MQQQQNPSALVSQLNNNPQSSSATTTSSLRSPPSATPLPGSQLSSSLPLVSPLPAPLRQTHLPSLPPDHVIGPVEPIAATHPSGEPALAVPPACPLPRVRLSDIALYDGAPAGSYVRAVEVLSGSLMRHNAALIELGCEDTALMRCGWEGSRLFFRSRAHLGGGKGSRGVHMYRAGRYGDYGLT